MVKAADFGKFFISPNKIRGELTKFAPPIRGHLVMVILVKIDFGNAVICSLYINILIFIYSGDYDTVSFRF